MQDGLESSIAGAEMQSCVMAALNCEVIQNALRTFGKKLY